MLSKLAIIYLLCASAWGSLLITSASVGSAGLAFTVATNSATTLTGSTASCISLSGGVGEFGSTPTVVISGTSLSVTAVSPAYAGQTITVSLAPSPGCALTGSTGNAATSSVTAANGSDYYAACDAHWSGLMTLQGSPACISDGHGFPNTAQFGATNGSVDVNVSSSAGTLAVWSFNASNAISLYIDGVLNSRQTLPSGTAYSEVIFSGLDTGVHSFRLVETGTASAFQILPAFRCPSCSFNSAPSVRSILTVCGASVVDVSGGGSATGNGDQQNWGLLQALGYTDQGKSDAGQALYTTLRDECPGAMATGGGATPVIGWMEADANDITADIALANVQSAAQTVVTNILANATPPTILYWPAIYPVTYNNSGVCNGLTAPQCNALYYNAEIAGVNAVGSPKVVVIHTQQLASGAPDWYNTNSPCGGSNDTQDGAHPCAATAIGQPGFGKIANRQAPIFLGQTLGHSFTSSGPSTAVQGSPSSLFTSTIAGSGSGVTWMDVVTIQSSVAGDRICITGGMCGNGSVAVSGGLGTATFTFTVNPSTTGARTISYTSLPDGWVAPSSATLTASSPSGTYLIP